MPSYYFDMRPRTPPLLAAGLSLLALLGCPAAVEGVHLNFRGGLRGHSHRGHSHRKAPAKPKKARLTAKEHRDLFDKQLPLEVELKSAPGVTVPGDVAAHVGKSSMLVSTLLIRDPSKKVAMGQGDEYPYWVSKLLTKTTRNVEAHDHTFLVRTDVRAPKPRWQPQECCTDAAASQGGYGGGSCYQYCRANVNWEKYQMLVDYLAEEKAPGKPRYSHVLSLDIDATFARADRDSMQAMASEMDRRNASLMVADEDWRGPKHGGTDWINGGVVMVRNTPETRRFLRSFLDAHEDPRGSGWQCWENEQLCLRKFIQDPKLTVPGLEIKDRLQFIHVASGMSYNRHPCALYLSPGEHCLTAGDAMAPEGVNQTTHIVHFMGGAKGHLHKNTILDNVM